MKRLQFERDLHSQLAGVVAQRLAAFDCQPPLLGRRNNLFVPDVLAQYE